MHSFYQTGLQLQAELISFCPWVVKSGRRLVLPFAYPVSKSAKELRCVRGLNPAPSLPSLPLPPPSSPPQPSSLPPSAWPARPPAPARSSRDENGVSMQTDERRTREREGRERGEEMITRPSVRRPSHNVALARSPSFAWASKTDGEGGATGPACLGARARQIVGANYKAAFTYPGRCSKNPKRM